MSIPLPRPEDSDINYSDINRKTRNLIKRCIFKCMCEDFTNNQAIFDKKTGEVNFDDIDLFMIMDKVVKGVEMAKNIIKESK